MLWNMLMTCRSTEGQNTHVKTVVANTVELTAFQGEHVSCTEACVRTNASAF